MSLQGKPCEAALGEQEEQKKREAESFFAQKDSGPNSERREVTPSTPPKKPGFWDWFVGLFGYETETARNWKQYQKLNLKKGMILGEDGEVIQFDDKEAEQSGPVLDDIDITKNIVLGDDGEIAHAVIKEAERTGPDLSDMDPTKSFIAGNDGEIARAVIKEAERTGPDLSDVDIKKNMILGNDGEVAYAVSEETVHAGPDLSGVDIKQGVIQGTGGKFVRLAEKTPVEQLRDLDQSFSRMAQALNPGAKPFAVGTDSSIPGDLALYCTVAAAQSFPSTVAEDLHGIFNGENLQQLAQAKALWEETPQNQRADLLVRGLARLSQMPAEPLGMGKDVIMSGLVIGNILQNLDGGLKFAVEKKLPIEGQEMVKGAQTLGEIGHRGLMSYAYLQNPRESAPLTPQQRNNMITYALEYEAASQVLDNHTPVWTGGLPTSTTLQPVLGREGGLQSLRNSVLQAERAAGQNSLFAMGVKTLAETMASRDNVKQHVPQMQPKAPAQQSHGHQQTRAQVTHQKTPNVMGRV